MSTKEKKIHGQNRKISKAINKNIETIMMEKAKIGN